MKDSPEIVAAMTGQSDLETMERRMTIRHAITSHRTFFCPCGGSLDVSDAQIIQIRNKQGGALASWQNFPVYCGKHDANALIKEVGGGLPSYEIRIIRWKEVITQ